MPIGLVAKMAGDAVRAGAIVSLLFFTMGQAAGPYHPPAPKAPGQWATYGTGLVAPGFALPARGCRPYLREASAMGQFFALATMPANVYRWNTPATAAADIAALPEFAAPNGIPTDWKVETSTMAQVRAVAAVFNIPVKASWRRRELLDAVKAGLAPLRLKAAAPAPAAPTPAHTLPSPAEPELPELPTRFTCRPGQGQTEPWAKLQPMVTYSQQQQQQQQAPAAAPVPVTACSYDSRRAEFTPATCFAKTGPVVAPGPKARKTAPARVPADVTGLLSRFGLSLDGLLTEGLSNAKLAKGAALAWPVILHHLPAKALAQAVAGAKPGPTAPRSRIAGLYELAEREHVLNLAIAHNGCPWASKGCAAGCLAWAGHGGMSATVAAARARRTLAYLADPAAYGRAVLWAICRAWARAQAKGLPLAVRLRGTDDLAWHLQRVTISPVEAQAIARRYGLPVAPGRGQTLPEALSLAPVNSLHFYEYSKAPLHGPQGLQAQRSAGWDVTASLAADRTDGLSHALAAVGAGFRLAVPVALPKGSALPEALLLRVHPDAGIWRLQCIDGDVTDHRWADPAGPQPGGFDGVAVILRTKTSRGRGPEAAAFSLAPTFGTWQPLAGGGQAALSNVQWEG